MQKLKNQRRRIILYDSEFRAEAPVRQICLTSASARNSESQRIDALSLIFQLLYIYIYIYIYSFVYISFIIKHFKNHGLAITIQSNLHIVNFLDVTLNLTDGSYFPYRKPDNTTQYIDARSNHPPSIIRQSQATLRGHPETKRTHYKFHVHDQRHLYTPTKYSVTLPQE